MFSIAASAAAQTAFTAKTLPLPPPPRKKPEKRTSSRSRWTSNNTPIIVYDTQALYGIKPILKRPGSSARSQAESTADETESTEDSSSSHQETRILKRELSVSFSNVEIREYIVQLGDAPFSEGPPICLSNERQNECIVDFLKFDDLRCRDRRGSSKFFRLSAPERSHLLLSMGYSMNDIANASVSSEQNRRELMQSLQNKKWDSFNAIKESATRRMKKMLVKGEIKNKIHQEPKKLTHRDSL